MKSLDGSILQESYQVIVIGSGLFGGHFGRRYA